MAWLDDALAHWRAHVDVALRQYKPQWLNRAGHVDSRAITADVERDIARSPATGSRAPPSAGK